MIIDTHSHLQFKAFEKDSDEVIKKTLSDNIWMINVGTKFETSRNAVEVAQNYQEGVFAAIGLHPIYAGAEFMKVRTDPDEGEFLIKEQDFNKEKYIALAQSKKVVAVGEIGLDYYYKPKTTAKLAQFKEKQKQVFIQQLDMARELHLPVILHCRMAHDEIIEILQSRKENNGTIHCFTGTWEQAKKYMDMGFYLGINGIVFKFNIDEVIKQAPFDKLLIETDCPYLTPPMAPDKRNEPIFTTYTIQKIAGLKGISFDEVCQKTTENARKLFNI